MSDKFAQYQNTEEKRDQFSEYVHLNFRLIWVKMLSEMRRKLDITPNSKNEEGYSSLMVSIQGRLFNEMVYVLAGICQSLRLDAREILPPATQRIILQLLNGENPLNGEIVTEVVSKEEFNKYYLANIDRLREDKSCLPKE